MLRPVTSLLPTWPDCLPTTKPSPYNKQCLHTVSTKILIQYIYATHTQILVTQPIHHITRLIFLRESTEYICDWATLYSLIHWSTYNVPRTVLIPEDTENDVSLPPPREV